MVFDDLNKGDKVDVHMGIAEKPLAVLDAACRRHGCSRASLVEAMIALYAADERLEPVRVKRGRPVKKA